MTKVYLLLKLRSAEVTSPQSLDLSKNGKLLVHYKFCITLQLCFAISLQLLSANVSFVMQDNGDFAQVWVLGTQMISNLIVVIGNCDTSSSLTLQIFLPNL